MHTQQLLAIADSVLLKVTSRPDIIMARGKGMHLWDTEGNQYLDFIGGWAVNCLGHSPQVLIDALHSQAQALINGSPSFYNVPMLEYAELLVKNTCLDRVFFMSTGAEANEGAIKLARKYGIKQKNGATDIITTQKSFHGRTLVTMAATGKPQWETLFGSRLPGFQKAQFNDIDSFRKLVSKDTCAIMLEPVQGEGGVNVATSGFMQALRALCDEHDILLILDEVQTGMGRTGKLFGYQHYGIEPDIMTLGKGIGGGYPLSAMLVKEKLDIFEAGDQGGTYTGQPLAMAVGLAVLRELLDTGLVDHCHKMGEFLKQELAGLAKTHEVENIRGLGLLVAFDLQKSKGEDIVNWCRDESLLINAPQEKSIRLMPPLIISAEHIETLIQKLKGCLAKK
ncbi:MAG: acetylornithine/succinylornithine family transaminase [Pseudomonadales bacterium]|nr:acetylornithine/succinylornithine family transaminase [Pseudomonadales bacterium]